jgi:probable addiction module antidote protein
MLSIAQETGLDRTGLYRALSGDTDPRFSTILKITNACGGRIAFIPGN